MPHCPHHTSHRVELHYTSGSSSSEFNFIGAITKLQNNQLNLTNKVFSRKLILPQKDNKSKWFLSHTQNYLICVWAHEHNFIRNCWNGLTCPRGDSECELHNKYMELCAKDQLGNSNWKQFFENLYLLHGKSCTYIRFLSLVTEDSTPYHIVIKSVWTEHSVLIAWKECVILQLTWQAG